MNSTMVKLVEIHPMGAFSRRIDGPKENFTLRETYINPKHVVFMREDDEIWDRIRDTPIGQRLDFGHEFTRLYISHGQNGMDVIVVGSIKEVQEKFNKSSQLLKG